jgi:thioredoxin reductase
MAKVAIVGDGPGGVSAAIFLARGGHDVVVFGQDETAMHYAFLNNFYGSPSVSGTELHNRGKEQALRAGARFEHRRIAGVTPERALSFEGGEDLTFDFVILSEGRKHPVADALGLELGDDGSVVVDRQQRTSIPGIYAVGRSTRPTRSQAIISAGQGAVAALDILATEAGEDVQDWDSPDG